MATRNQVVFRGVFEKVEDRAHNRLRLVARIDSGTRALFRPCPGCTCGATCPSLKDCQAARLSRIEIGHVERSLFTAKEPQAPVTDEETEFGLWLAAAPGPDGEDIYPAPHWLTFHATRIYGPTVEVIEEPA